MVVDPDRQNRIFFQGQKKLVDQALPHLMPLEADALRPGQEIMQTYEDAKTGDPEALHRLYMMGSMFGAILMIGPSTRRLLAEEGVRRRVVGAAANARKGKANKAEREKEKQRKAAPAIATAIRAVAKDRGTPIEKLLVTRIPFIRDHVIGSVNKVLAARELPIATESDVAFTIKEMLRSAL